MDWGRSDYKLALVSLVVFVVWFAAAIGWTRWLAVLGLVYPAVVGLRLYRGWSDER
jgi:hypothetical protein